MALVLFWITAAIVCGIIAHNKGRSVVGWVALGVLFSWLAVIVVAVMSPLEVPGKKTCPQCAERIMQEAKLCRFCGYAYSEAELLAAPAKPADDSLPLGGAF